MTVKRKHKEKFHAPVELVINAIQTVLAEEMNSYRYDKPVFDKDNKGMFHISS